MIPEKENFIISSVHVQYKLQILMHEAAAKNFLVRQEYHATAGAGLQ